MEKLDTKFTEEKPRYYVVRMDDEGKRPTRPFVTRGAAHRSAEKLARKNPNVDFIVVKLKATLRYKKTEEVPVVESKESTDTGNVGA